MRRIALIQGHPDPGGGHLDHALADGAAAAGHEPRRIEIASLDFPLLRSKSSFEQESTPPALLAAQDAIV